MITEGWKREKLTSLADFINGYAFKPDDWGKEGLPIIRIEQLKDPNKITDFYNGKLPSQNIIENGDLIFSWSASLFLSIWKHGKAALNQHLFKVIEKNGIDRIFLKYIIEFYIPVFEGASHGSTMKHITRKALNTFEVDLPENNIEQSLIAEILSTVDRAIEQTEAVIAKLQRIKAGLMQDLLTRGIDEQGNIRSEKTHRFKDSPLGRIPVEWEVVELDALLRKKEYGISTSLDDNYSEKSIPILRMNNLNNGEIYFNDLKYSNNQQTLNLLLQEGDIIFNRTNSIEYVGRTAIFRKYNRPISFASYLVRLVVKKEKIDSEYLNYWMNLEKTQSRIKGLATIGVQQANVNPTNLGKLMISFPSKLSEQRRIVERIDAIRKSVDMERQNLLKLMSVKTALMQDLLTGRVRVTGLLKKRQAEVAVNR